jgi:hypothetical protein
MEQPTVCAVMLVNGREEMVKRAVRSFAAQSYLRRELILCDTRDPFFEPEEDIGIGPALIVHRKNITHSDVDKSIGVLRNLANSRTGCQIICHWDSDDWSHPNRITEQVALLRTSGMDCVGYREMLFWRRNADEWDLGDAWLYRHHLQTYCIGTSLCYWRRVWEQRPFEDLPRPGGGTGEDHKWLEGVQSLGCMSTTYDGKECEPRMIATIHGANTNQQNYNEVLRGNSPQWKRVPEWDERVRKMLEGA